MHEEVHILEPPIYVCKVHVPKKIFVVPARLQYVRTVVIECFLSTVFMESLTFLEEKMWWVSLA
jgi:hypothetical protein